MTGGCLFQYAHQYDTLAADSGIARTTTVTSIALNIAHGNGFAARCYEQARPMPSCRCLLSDTFVYCVETAKDTATVAVVCEQETAPKLSNGTIFNDLDFKVTIFSTTNKSTTVQDRAILTMRH